MFKTTDGETFRKTGPLTFENMVGIEQYIDPLFDRKIGVGGDVKPDVDTSARIVKATDTPKKSTKKSKKSKKSK